MRPVDGWFTFILIEVIDWGSAFLWFRNAAKNIGPNPVAMLTEYKNFFIYVKNFLNRRNSYLTMSN